MSDDESIIYQHQGQVNQEHYEAMHGFEQNRDDDYEFGEQVVMEYAIQKQMGEADQDLGTADFILNYGQDRMKQAALGVAKDMSKNKFISQSKRQLSKYASMLDLVPHLNYKNLYALVLGYDIFLSQYDKQVVDKMIKNLSILLCCSLIMF